MPAITAQTAVAVVGIDIGKNSFHIVALDNCGAIVLRQKWSRNHQVEARFANMPPCLIGMEACVGAHPVGDGAAFCKGRHFAAWLGLVPKLFYFTGSHLSWRAVRSTGSADNIRTWR